MAAMSEMLTMAPHQPANHGSPATNSFMKPSMANSRYPSPSGMAAQSSPTGMTPAPDRPSDRATDAMSLLAAMPLLDRRRCASAAMASEPIITQPASVATGSRPRVAGTADRSR